MLDEPFFSFPFTADKKRSGNLLEGKSQRLQERDADGMGELQTSRSSQCDAP